MKNLGKHARALLFGLAFGLTATSASALPRGEICWCDTTACVFCYEATGWNWCFNLGSCYSE